MVDLLGALLLLLPFVAVILWFALPYVARSWAMLERSRETSGLPFVFLLKTVIPLFAVLLACRASRRRSAPHACSGTRTWRPNGGALMRLAETLAVLMVVAVCVRCWPAIRSRSRSAACRSPSRSSATSPG